MTIVITGLAASMEKVQAWIRFGASTVEKQAVVEAPVVSGQALLSGTAPDLGLKADRSVDVWVVIADGTVLNAGKYTYNAA
jgi:hypothetical protein